MPWWAGVLLAAAYALACLPRAAGGAARVPLTVRGCMHRGSVVLPVDADQAFHVHHWVLYLPVLAWAAARAHGVMAGFALGMVAQGLHYHDRFHFLCPNPYRTDTYAAAPSRMSNGGAPS